MHWITRTDNFLLNDGQLTFISRKNRIKTVPDTVRAYLTEGARKTDKEGYPIIESWMVPESVPPDLKVVPLNDISGIRKKIGEYYICSYCADEKIQTVLRNSGKYCKLFRKSRGLLGFDLSPYSDMPLVKQKNQMYDNLALTFFYGMRNIPVIPNVRCGNDETIEEFLQAIPKHRMISIGAYGCVNSRKEKQNYRDFLRMILPELTPSGIIVYGGFSTEVFEEFLADYSFFPVPVFRNVRDMEAVA